MQHESDVSNFIDNKHNKHFCTNKKVSETIYRYFPLFTFYRQLSKVNISDISIIGIPTSRYIDNFVIIDSTIYLYTKFSFPVFLQTDCVI